MKNSTRAILLMTPGCFVMGLGVLSDPVLVAFGMYINAFILSTFFVVKITDLVLSYLRK